MLARRLSSLAMGSLESNGLLAHGLAGSGEILRRLAGLYHLGVFCCVEALLEVVEVEPLRADLECRDAWRKLSW